MSKGRQYTLAGLHAHEILARRRAEKPRVLATELRRAVVTNRKPGRPCIGAFRQHKPPRFLKPQLLLISLGCHARNRFKMLVQGRRTHACRGRDIIDAQALIESGAVVSMARLT